jgi:hypothetical protein
MRTPEGRVKALISAWLKANNIYYFMPVQSGYGAAGLDYFCCWHGEFVALEAKAGTKLTARQERTMVAIENSGGRAFVVGPTEIIGRLEEIDALVRRYPKSIDL